jgi:hypothetical protein
VNRGFNRWVNTLHSSRNFTDSLPSYKLIADNTTPTESSVRRVDDHDGGGLGSPARIEAVKDVGAGGPLGRLRLGTKTPCTAHQFDQPHPISAGRPSDHR